MKKTILIAVATLSTIGAYSASFADFDCSTIDREEIKTILDKQRDGTTLSTDEATLLANAKTCMHSGSGSFARPNHGSGSENFGSGMKMPPKGEMGSGNIMPPKDGSGSIEKGEGHGHGDKLKSGHKKSVDNLMTKFEKSLDGKEYSVKESFLNTLLEKVEKAQTKIENSSMSDSKKETYINILEYLQESIESAIDDLSDSDEIDALSELGL